MKLEDDFKSNDSHNLFKSVQELEAKPKKSLMVAKNQKKNKSRKTEEVLLKFGKNISNKTSIWNLGGPPSTSGNEMSSTVLAGLAISPICCYK